MFRILFAQDGLIHRNSPINTKRIIKNTDATIRLWMIKLIALILKNSSFAQYRKAMSKPLRDIKLTVVVLG